MSTLVAASARRHAKVPPHNERAVIWVINERPCNGTYRVVVDVDGTIYWPGKERIVYSDSVELLSPELYPPRADRHRGGRPPQQRRRGRQPGQRWYSSSREGLRAQMRHAFGLTAIVLCCIAPRIAAATYCCALSPQCTWWSAQPCPPPVTAVCCTWNEFHSCTWSSTMGCPSVQRVGLLQMDLIVPHAVWEHAAAKIVRSPDTPFPGCGAQMLGPGTAGNNNEGMWYLTLEGTEPQLHCAEQILDDARGVVP